MIRLFVVYSTIKYSENLPNNCAEEFGICLFFVVLLPRCVRLQLSECAVVRMLGTRNSDRSTLAARY